VRRLQDRAFQTCSLLSCRCISYLAASYQSFKAVEGNRPEEIKKWAKFWVILGFYTAAQPLLDALLFWLPLYNEARLAMLLYLWYPGELQSCSGATHLNTPLSLLIANALRIA
jgi:hypothetical protein